jgi:hypothetical protein
MILRQASAVFCGGGARPPVEARIAFIDDHRAVYGVEPICRRPTTPMPPADPSKAPPRVRHDAVLREPIRRVRAQNVAVDGVRKVWRQLGREGIEVARCAVAKSLAQPRGRRARHPRRGGLAPSPPPARAHRQHPACRSRSAQLRRTGERRLGGAGPKPTSLRQTRRGSVLGASELARNKADRLDAALIARFCRAQTPAAWMPPAPRLRELRELVRRCDALKAARVQELNRQRSGVRLSRRTRSEVD